MQRSADNSLNTINNYILRIASVSDIPAIIKMYQDTVRNVNIKDYSGDEINVWASGADNFERWEKAVSEQYFVLAYNNTDETLTGFSSIAKDGYLDFMYVCKDHQREGVASLLLDAVEQKAAEQNNNEIYSHVSKTAKGFFLKRGYEHIRDIEDPYRGVIFINALMIKKLL